jgi:hypothetical protein
MAVMEHSNRRVDKYKSLGMRRIIEKSAPSKLPLLASRKQKSADVKGSVKARI